MTNNSYPILTISKKINDIIETEIYLNEPKPPLQPQSPVYNDFSSGFFSNAGSLCILISIFPIIGSFTQADEADFSRILMFGGIILLIGFVLAFIAEKLEGMASREYEIIAEKYKNDVNKFVSESNRHIREMEKYYEYKSNTKDFNAKDRIQKLHKHLRSMKFEYEIETYTKRNNSRGIAINYFQDCLKRVNNIKIYNESIVKINDYSTEYLLRPDILIQIKNISNGLSFILNIEIDEPYTGKTKEPINYKLNLMTNRDNKLANLTGIIIIRFAEIQIIKYPEECLNFIIELMNSLSNGDKIHIRKIPEVKTWEHKQALKMANDNFRNNYIPNILLQELKNEDKKYLSDYEREDYEITNLGSIFDDYDDYI